MKSGGLRALRAPIFFAGLAGLIALGVGFAEVRSHGYGALGFERNRALVLEAHLLRGLGLGLGVGLVYAVCTALGSAAIRSPALRARPVVAVAGLLSGLLAGIAAMLAVLGLAAFAPYRVAETLREREVAVAIGLCGLVVAAALAGRLRGFDPLREVRRAPLGLPWVLIALAVVPIAFRGPTLSAANPKNVLLIAVDTLRADHTSLDGDATPGPTPQLARLADRGTVFTRAISQAPWTMPAFASVLTGRYPREHGAISLFGRLRRQETTLAEVLREAGYWTGGVVSHVFVDADHGFAQGFDHYDVGNVIDEQAITSSSVSDAALALLAAHRGEPFLLFLHYFDPHYAYRDHAGYEQADGFRGAFPELADIERLREASGRLDDAQVAHLRDLYDEEIAHTDAQIGRVLDGLDALGLAEDTAVVVVADHGEEFLERGWLGHTIHLHDELVRVPLVVALPGMQARVARVAAPVETRSVAPTLLDYLGIAAAPLPLEASLLPRMRGVVDGSAEAFSEVWLPDAPEGSPKRVRITGLRTPRWVLFRDHDAARSRLYDLETDPGESDDVSGAQPEVLARLDARLARFLARMDAGGGEVPTQAPDPALREQLRALGYLEGD